MPYPVRAARCTARTSLARNPPDARKSLGPSGVTRVQTSEFGPTSCTMQVWFPRSAGVGGAPRALFVIGAGQAELSRRAVKEADAEMFFQLRDMAGDRSLAELALTGDSRKRARSTTRTRIPSAPRRSIDFLEKRKGHAKQSGIIAPRQEAH